MQRYEGKSVLCKPWKIYDFLKKKTAIRDWVSL